MKTQLRFLLIGAAFALALACAACRGGAQIEDDTVGTEALMTGLTIGKIRIPAIPTQVDAFDFEDESYNVSNMPLEIAPLQRSSDAESTRLKPSVSKGAKVKYGIGAENQAPFRFDDVRVLANFDDGDYLYFQVTAEDGSVTNYYRFNVWVQSPVVDLVEVYIGEYRTHEWVDPNGNGNATTIVDVDERMMATLATPSSSLSAAMLASAGALDIMSKQAGNAEIKVTPAYSGIKLRYAVTKDEGRPVFGTNNKFDLADQHYLYIEVTAENNVDIVYYRILVGVGRIATIKKLTFIGKDNAEFEISSKGTPMPTFGATTMPGKFETADMPVDGFGVTYELDDPTARCTWLLYGKSLTATPPNFGNPPAKALFNGNNRLVLRVISENGKAMKFYKIDVDLLAVKIKTHPQSDYYYYYSADTKVGNGDEAVSWYVYAASNFKDFSTSQIAAGVTSRAKSSPVPLTVELESAMPAGTKYQWYEANSWYGGYGFDADGRMMYIPPGDDKGKPEDGFQSDSYHIQTLDEKNNITLHNGGNQYYRLPTEGRPISGKGGTFSGTTVPPYTPTIDDKRPFLSGYTSEIHYYWVVITDESFSPARKAVSKRAAIITERDPRKDHYIVNMYAYEDHPYGDLYLKGDTSNPDEITETGTARNPKVFTYMRETYKIPVTFPAGFNINDYTVSTVQALFWLIDGTPWIQNWTQGDIGFEDKDGKRVMYYNLTNNNATLGLVGAGKEPNGGTVDFTPQYLIVKPAGEKPVKQLPPLDANNKPIPNNQAQGWFCGFIELVEVRFEGPAR